jgi:CRP-like cAMP-binding protein
MREERAFDLLSRVTPFQFLSSERLEALSARLERRSYADGQILVREGELSRDVFLLESGEVEAVSSEEPGKVLSTILPGHYVGERAALFEQGREVTLRAKGEVVAWSLTGKDFLELVDHVPVFAQALANALKVKQGIFRSYRRLYARILTLLDEGEFLLSELLPDYASLRPALHPLLRNERIDVGALSYAVARLPSELTRTSFYYLAGTLPELYRDPNAAFEAIETRARRRSAWSPMPGKIFILLRDGISDVTDFLTCLCLYACEAKKIRRRLRSPENLAALGRLASSTEPLDKNERAEEFLSGLDLDPQERDGLRRIWPDRWPQVLRNIILHHEDIAIECDVSIDDYNSRASERWVSQIQERARSLVDLEHPNLDVHIISSNTHSVANCLSPYLADEAETILGWGREYRPDLAGTPTEERPWGGHWKRRTDLLYVTARDYVRRVPGAAEAMEAAGRANGHERLTSTAFTGIEVDLFCVQKLDPERCDAEASVRKTDHPVLIVNVDYAFGQQAEELLANLLFVFGRRVRSVNVLGKAGGLVGSRGDILLAGATLLQTNDELYPMPNRDLPPELLRELSPEIAVHEGPVLTVAGTLLQDRALLYFYRRIWKSVGLEMEGSFFARQLISAIETGVCRPDVRSRFAYYTSDVPLQPGENLSEPMKPWEGVPPLYTITRAILNRIFGS